MPSVKWGTFNQTDVAVPAANLNALASAAYALGNAIDNSTALLLYADLEISLSSAVTAGAGNPYVGVYVLPALSTGNYPTTNGAATAGVTSVALLAGTIQVPASTAVQYLYYPRILLPPGPFKIELVNQLGVAFPSTATNSCLLRRYTEQAV